MPDLTAPDVSAPDVSAPDVSAPDVSAPDVSAPDVSAPDPTAGGRMLVDAVTRQVVSRHPVDGREARSRDRMLVALGRLGDPLDRDADPTHVTGSALVCGPKGLLLLRHKRLDILVQPGGHLERGETPWEAARREGEEETGLTLRLVGDPGTARSGAVAPTSRAPRRARRRSRTRTSRPALRPRSGGRRRSGAPGG